MNYVYAVGCRDVKADCFRQLEMADTIIQIQRATIIAQDSLYLTSLSKYQLCENNLTEAQKQAKKEKLKRKVNAGLFYISFSASAIFAGLYFLAK